MRENGKLYESSVGQDARSVVLIVGAVPVPKELTWMDQVAPSEFYRLIHL